MFSLLNNIQSNEEKIFSIAKKLEENGFLYEKKFMNE